MSKRTPKHAANPPEDRPSCGAAEHAKNVEKIYREERGSLVLSLRRVLPSRDECLDAIQDVFVRILARRDLEDVRSRESYVQGAVKNKAYDQRRRRKCWGDIEQLLPNDQQSSRQPSPEEACEGAELADRLTLAMAALPEDQRLALTLAKSDGLSVAEAAVRMGCREHKVRRLIAEALLRLQAAIAEGSGEADE